MPQLGLSSSKAEDAPLLNPQQTFWMDTSYVRHANFQVEMRDIEPQSGANLGATATFVIPKAADLVSNVDLMVEFNMPEPPAPASLAANEIWGWVENVGHAMIDKITFTVGNTTTIEEISGDHLNIINELMRTQESRHTNKLTGKTGRPLAHYDANGDLVLDSDLTNASHDRIIGWTDSAGGVHWKEGKKLYIPLGLYFTKHPSNAYPLAAIAGCNEMRIQIKFRPMNELICVMNAPSMDAFGNIKAYPTTQNLDKLKFMNSQAFTSGSCKLRCHYVHVTGPEATSIMNKEHVKLHKLWHGNEMSVIKTLGQAGITKNETVSMDLSFLHPVVELIVTIRKVADMTSALTGKDAMRKNRFAYQGGGQADVNIESYPHKRLKEPLTECKVLEIASTTVKNAALLVEGRWEDGDVVVFTNVLQSGGTYASMKGTIDTGAVYRDGKTIFTLTAAGVFTLATWTAAATASTAGSAVLGAYGISAFKTPTSVMLITLATPDTFIGQEAYLKTKNFKLTLNGQTRHLDGQGLDRDYLMERLMPAVHSSANTMYSDMLTSTATDNKHDIRYLADMVDRKEIYSIPFALNPESNHPSGHVNFSAVSHAKLEIALDAYDTSDYQFDVYALYYNWSTIKDGRQFMAFA